MSHESRLTQRGPPGSLLVSAKGSGCGVLHAVLLDLLLIKGVLSFFAFGRKKRSEALRILLAALLV